MGGKRACEAPKKPFCSTVSQSTAALLECTIDSYFLSHLKLPLQLIAWWTPTWCLLPKDVQLSFPAALPVLWRTSWYISLEKLMHDLSLQCHAIMFAQLVHLCVYLYTIDSFNDWLREVKSLKYRRCKFGKEYILQPHLKTEIIKGFNHLSLTAAIKWQARKRSLFNIGVLYTDNINRSRFFMSIWGGGHSSTSVVKKFVFKDDITTC